MPRICVAALLPVIATFCITHVPFGLRLPGCVTYVIASSILTFGYTPRTTTGHTLYGFAAHHGLPDYITATAPTRLRPPPTHPPPRHLHLPPRGWFTPLFPTCGYVSWVIRSPRFRPVLTLPVLTLVGLRFCPLVWYFTFTAALHLFPFHVRLYPSSAIFVPGLRTVYTMPVMILPYHSY